MAETKKYAQWIDIPDGSGGLARKYVKDVEARKSILNYVQNTSGTAGSTATDAYNRTQWTGSVDGVTALYTGLVVLYKVPVAGVSKGVTLNINSLGEHPVVVNIANNISSRYDVGCIIPLVYDADQKASVYVNNTNTEFTGCWKMTDYTDGNTYPQAQCETAAGTQAKTATCTNFSLANKSYIMVNMGCTNSYNGKITLNINSKGAKDIYINGAVSSSSNKTLPAGSYLVYYQDSKFYFRTDGKITGSITGDAATVNGKTVAVNVPSGAVFTDTTYESKSASSGGSDVSLVTTGEKYTWNNKGTYSKPNGGIPKTDLASAVQASLGLADSALQSHQDISGKQDKVAKFGSTTKPIYTSAAGTFAECSTYAGGTAVTLNGTSKAASTASMYAPTSAGTSGQVLVSSGSGAPTWENVASVQTCQDIISELL